MRLIINPFCILIVKILKQNLFKLERSMSLFKLKNSCIFLLWQQKLIRARISSPICIMSFVLWMFIFNILMMYVDGICVGTSHFQGCGFTVSLLAFCMFLPCLCEFPPTVVRYAKQAGLEPIQGYKAGESWTGCQSVAGCVHRITHCEQCHDIVTYCMFLRWEWKPRRQRKAGHASSVHAKLGVG